MNELQTFSQRKEVNQMAEVTVRTELDGTIEKLDALCKSLAAAEGKAFRLQFITVRQLAEMTGWSVPTAQEVFRRKDFPSCNFGKEQIAYIEAVRDYFMTPRRK